MGQHELQGLKAIDLVMGYHCNVRCIFCLVADYSPRRVLDRRVWGEALLPAYDVVDNINMQGGEPTVLEGCRGLLQLLMENHPKVKLDIMTNGVRFEGIFEDIYLKQGKFVNFSLNAVDRSVYDKVMVGSNHQRVFTNFERFIKRRDETGSPVEIGASMVVTQPNLNQIAPFIRYCRDRRISAQITTDCILSAEVDLGMARAAISEGYEAAEGAPDGEVVGLNEYDWLLAMLNGVEPVRERYAGVDRTCGKVCHVPYERLFVDIDGTCQVCCQSWYPIGNLKKQSLVEIWNGERMNRFRERMKEGDYSNCGITCMYNPSPVSSRSALMRKVAFKATRDPWLYLKKANTKRKMKNSLRKLKVAQSTAGSWN